MTERGEMPSTSGGAAQGELHAGVRRNGECAEVPSRVGSASAAAAAVAVAGGSGGGRYSACSTVTVTADIRE